jgi:hypothetical protein
MGVKNTRCGIALKNPFSIALKRLLGTLNGRNIGEKRT